MNRLVASLVAAASLTLASSLAFADVAPPPDAGTDAATSSSSSSSSSSSGSSVLDAGSNANIPGDAGGGGCSSGPSPTSAIGMFITGVGVLLMFRRRRAA